MALRQPQTITDVNVYLETQGYLGAVKELTLPIIEKETRAQENAGHTRAIDLGFFKELNLDFTLQQLAPEAAAWLAVGKFIDTPILFKGAIREGKDNKSFLGVAKGIITKYEYPKFSPKAEVDTKIEMKLSFFSAAFDGSEFMLFDTENMIAIIDGVDHLADVRAALL